MWRRSPFCPPFDQRNYLSAATKNSLNHDGDGQNVLYGDGHVEFQQNPFVGVKRDNIFTRRAASTGFASAPAPIGQSPYDADDSVLLPPEE